MTEDETANGQDGPDKATHLEQRLDRLRYNKVRGDEFATDPRTLSSPPTVAGDGAGEALFDLRSAVLLDGIVVNAIEGIRFDEGTAEQMMYVLLSGRINKSEDRVDVGFVLNLPYISALIVHLLATARLFGAKSVDELTDALVLGAKEHDADLAQLRAALDQAIGRS